MNLLQVKNSLFDGPGQDYVREGMSLSEPILSMHGGRLVDNYFIYYENLREYFITGPTLAFGVDSETADVVYVKTADVCHFHIGPYQQIKVKRNILDAKDLYEKYVNTYEEMRKIAFSEICSKEQVRLLHDYYTNFVEMLDENVLQLYKVLSPEFFSWIQQF